MGRLGCVSKMLVVVTGISTITTNNIGKPKGCNEDTGSKLHLDVCRCSVDFARCWGSCGSGVMVIPSRTWSHTYSPRMPHCGRIHFFKASRNRTALLRATIFSLPNRHTLPIPPLPPNPISITNICVPRLNSVTNPFIAFSCLVPLPVGYTQVVAWCKYNLPPTPGH